MRLAHALAAVSVLTVLGSGCGQDSTAPGSISESKAALSDDFDYIAKPPHVQVTPAKLTPGAIPFCNSSIGPLICYTPTFLRTAYNFPRDLDGTGQTIVIVDAFGSPTIATDLAQFDAAFGIPDPPSFQVICAEGCPPFNPQDTKHDVVGWSVETSLDVEYAHAMAPGARIVLVVAATSSGNAINNAERKVLSQFPGAIMSQSFGIPEILLHGNNGQIDQAHKNYEAAQQAGITVIAGAGDFGATNGFATANPQFPASDPLVTGVGGTQGHPHPNGLVQLSGNTPVAYGAEEVWNEPQPGFEAATGGALSRLFPPPAYQSGLKLTGRGVPDVGYNAAINGGVLVLDNALGGFFIVGGTSAGAPQWAAIVALANQLKGGSLGFINPTLYQIACSSNYAQDFHDITIGNNQLVNTPVGFSAATGWDAATGLGTPNVASLVHDLVTPPTCPS
jgi:subtilase family serine protease